MGPRSGMENLICKLRVKSWGRTKTIDFTFSVQVLQWKMQKKHKRKLNATLGTATMFNENEHKTALRRLLNLTRSRR